MLATMLVATHSHSPWSSLPRERICRVPPGSVLCLLLLGFPTLGKERGGAGQREKKNTTQKRVVGQGEAAVGSLSYLRGPGDTAGHRQGIWSLRSRQGSRFPRFREDLAGQRKKHASGRMMPSTHTQAENPTALTRTPSPAPGLNLRHPKPKPLRREVYWPPLANTLPGPGKAPPAPGDAQTAPQPAAEERQDPSHQRFGQQGPHGDAGGWRAWRCPGALKAERKNGACNNSCLHPAAKVVQIPRCPESSSAVLHAGVSAD